MKYILIENFKTFDLSKHLKIFDKLIIQQKTQNTFYSDRNKGIKSLDNIMEKCISYYNTYI